MRHIATLMLFCQAAFAAVNGTTPTGLNLKSTFECISVSAPFTGDENGNNSAVVKWRQASGSWLSSYTPYIDRNVRIVTSDFTQDNPVSNQCRVSIVGLAPNASYDVWIEWADGDGITGAASITNTISTRSYTIPVNGTQLYVDASAVSEGVGTSGDPFKTITNAIAQCVAGDTINVRDGTYGTFTWTKSGTVGAFINLKKASGHSPVIQGGNFTRQILLSANNVAIDGFNFAMTTNKAIELSAGVSNVFIQNNAINLYTNDGAIGVSLANAQNTNIFILTNSITGTQPTTNDSFTTYGVFIGAQSGGLVIADNTTRYFRDGVGTGNGWTHGANDSDIARNNIFDYYDDPCEIEGDFVNSRYWGNAVLSTNGQTQLGLAGAYIGPVYIYRNTAGGTNTRSGTYGVKFYPTLCAGRIHMFHNVFDTSQYTYDGPHEVLSGSGTNAEIKNNIFMARGNNIYAGEAETDFDYNCYTNLAGSDFTSNWNGLTTYATFALFVAGTDEEDHGIYAVPQLTSSYAPNAGSPVIDSGVALQGFNDVNSPWLFHDAAPDIGAFERNNGTIGTRGKRARPNRR